jgi:hypothetical protein
MAFIILVDVNLNKLTPLRQLKIKNKKTKKQKTKNKNKNIYSIHFIGQNKRTENIHKEKQGIE